MSSKTVILLLSFSLLLCQAAPVKRQANDSDTELFDQLEIVKEGLNVMQLVEGRSFCLESSVGKCVKKVESHVGQRALCYVYDRYMDYSQRLLSTPPDSDLFATYTANKYVAWKNLNSTCSLVRLNTTNTLSACTLPEIGRVCTIYRIYEHFEEILPLLDKAVIREKNRTGREPSAVSVPDWLQSNLAPEPESITLTLRNVFNCTESSPGDFTGC